MKKILNGIKKWSFLILVMVLGVGYLSVTNQWQIYKEPLEELQKAWQTVLYDAREEDEPQGEMPGADETEELIADATSDEAENESIAGTETGAETQSGEEETITEEPGAEEPEVGRDPENIKYISVEDDYFKNAVFIGDSRTVGLFEYGDLENISTFYASTGLTVHKLFDSPIIKVEGKKQKKTVEQALSENTFSEIYLMIGINEMGTGTVDTFMKAYEEAVAHLRELQPDATIYLQAIMKVTTERSEQGDYITNEGIDARNERIAELADNVNVFYLDVNPLISDETGGMEPSYTFDGVHLKAQYIPIWKDYLKTHVVE